jgi:hypothetical protein
MEVTMYKKGLLLASAFLIVSGCSSKPGPSQDEIDSFEHYENIVKDEYQRIGEVLSRSALLSSKSVAVLARTKQGLVASDLTSEEIRLLRWQNEYIPVNMEMTISDWAWDGPPEPVLKRMASAAKYELQFVNQRPPISKSVTISADTRNIKNYILSVDQQTDGYIEKIYIDDRTDRKLITVYYSSF